MNLESLFWFILIFSALFMAFRFVLLWYWRVNEIVGLLKENRDLNKRIVDLLETSTGQAADPETIAQSVYRHLDENLNTTIG